MRSISLTLLAALLIVLPACNRRGNNEAAVRQALQQYLSSRPNLNMQGMEMRITTLQVKDEKAEADVTFTARNDAKASMSMHYSLKRRRGQWEVEPRGGAHSGMAPPQESGSAGELPPGHPAVKQQ
jgi:hypothetical protein